MVEDMERGQVDTISPTALESLQALAIYGPLTAPQMAASTGRSRTAVAAGIRQMEPLKYIEFAGHITVPSATPDGTTVERWQITDVGRELIPQLVAWTPESGARRCPGCHQLIVGDNLHVEPSGRRRCAACVERRRTEQARPKRTVPELAEVAAAYRRLREAGRRAVPALAAEWDLPPARVHGLIAAARAEGLLPPRGW